MNFKTLQSTAAFALVASLAAAAAFASTAVRADEADASQHAIQFKGSRPRAEVMAEAALVSATRSNEPAGSRVAAPVNSVVDRSTVRAQAAQAVRTGQIPHGEGGQI